MRKLVLATALFALASPAFSQGTCALTNSSQGLVNFGLYQSLGAHTDGVGTITISCTPALPAVPVSYTISIGAGGAAVFNPRRLSAGGYSLSYNLYVDPTRQFVWGDGTTAGTQRVAGACIGSCPVPVYGRVFGGQSVPAMNYRDDVLVTLDF